MGRDGRVLGAATLRAAQRKCAGEASGAGCSLKYGRLVVGSATRLGSSSDCRLDSGAA